MWLRNQFLHSAKPCSIIRIFISGWGPISIPLQGKRRFAAVFLPHTGELLPREVILKAVWGDDDYFIGRSMDVFITRLRKYLKDEPCATISNIHGVGFVFDIREP